MLNNKLISRTFQNDVNNALIQKGLKIDTQSLDLLFRFHTYSENAINSGMSRFSPFYGFGRFEFPSFGYAMAHLNTPKVSWPLMPKQTNWFGKVGFREVLP